MSVFCEEMGRQDFAQFSSKVIKRLNRNAIKEKNKVYIKLYPIE